MEERGCCSLQLSASSFFLLTSSPPSLAVNFLSVSEPLHSILYCPVSFESAVSETLWQSGLRLHLVEAFQVPSTPLFQTTACASTFKPTRNRFRTSCTPLDWFLLAEFDSCLAVSIAQH